MIKVAVILPKNDWDYLANTVLDGLFQMKKEGKVEFQISSGAFSRLPIQSLILSKGEFIRYARDEADLICFLWGKNSTDFELADKINRWNKTIFIDGSEPGKDGRYDFNIQRGILDGSYKGRGAVNFDMLARCALYLRREKPYIKGIIPFPYGIESTYAKHYNPSLSKDIDFVCIFGQEEFPILRKHVRELLEDYCRKEGFICRTEKTSNEDEFYQILARSKVGISIGGGGFDTARFWEILGNNCILLTETIDIFQPNSKELDYKRIWQFKNLYDFQYQLQRLGDFLRTKYNQKDLGKEYKEILSKHSSKARVMEIINAAREKGLII
ncbi:MAG: hypothetical protein HY451_01690 [Parcubacteria group bacterium]|nr:hypothetical protein [Parcubacteria group bacterium]